MSIDYIIKSIYLNILKHKYNVEYFYDIKCIVLFNSNKDRIVYIFNTYRQKWELSYSHKNSVKAKLI